MNENGELIKSESKSAEVLNNFFSNAVKNLEIPEYHNFNSNIENVKDLVFRAILKHKNQPSIIAITEKSKDSTFSVHEIENKKIMRKTSTKYQSTPGV